MYIERNIEKSILEATKEYPVIMVCGEYSNAWEQAI